MRALGAVMCVGALLLTAVPVAAANDADPTSSPNIVLILTDDQRAGTEAGMPATSALLAANGVAFSNAVVPTSWCCPSRASLLTGQFSHTLGVWENSSADPYGAWPAFAAGGWEEKSLPVYLDEAGYRTGLFGKYLNQANLAGRGYVPPGWDTFDAFLGGNYFRYRLSSDPQPVKEPRRYLTDELAARATEFIASSSDPFFVYFAAFAPHHPYDPGPYLGASAPYRPAAFAATNFPAPTYMQEDVSHHPGWMSKLPTDGWWRRAPGQVPLGTVGHVATMQQDTLMGVDAAVAAIVDEVARAGKLSNTLFVLTSDNGYAWGEHRLLGKNTPYDASVSVPLLMRFDGVLPAGRVSDQLVAANVDVFATIAELAGLPVSGVDGTSVLDPPREGVVLEASRWRSRQAYCGWRTKDAMFVRYADGFEELYDYATDPYELSNLARDGVGSPLLDRMRASARDACQPTAPGFTWPDTSASPAPAGNVTASWLDKGVVRVTWTAPPGLGKLSPEYQVLVSPRPKVGSSLSKVERSQDLSERVRAGEKLACARPVWPRGLRCDVRITPREAARSKFVVRAVFPEVALSAWDSLPRPRK